MKDKASPKNKSAGKLNPIPVRFCDDESVALNALSQNTGLSVSHIVRIAVGYALPKMKSGEVKFSDLIS